MNDNDGGRAFGRSVVRSFGRSVVRSVLIEHAIAGRRSNAMKLRRELSPPVFVAVARRLRISAKIIFFPAQGGGWGSERGRGLEGRAVILLLGRKNGILILGRGWGIMWGKR